jgi:hypothetical protein
MGTCCFSFIGLSVGGWIFVWPRGRPRKPSLYKAITHIGDIQLNLFA